MSEHFHVLTFGSGLSYQQDVFDWCYLLLCQWYQQACCVFRMRHPITGISLSLWCFTQLLPKPGSENISFQFHFPPTLIRKSIKFLKNVLWCICFSLFRLVFFRGPLASVTSCFCQILKRLSVVDTSADWAHFRLQELSKTGDSKEHFRTEGE